MITPKFECSQTETNVEVRLYTPAIRASDVEIHVEENLLSVHVNPYFLRLHLPGSVIEDDSSSALYDASSGYLIVNLTKVNRGEHFKDLDIIASLLAAPAPEPSSVPPLIEVVGGDEDGEMKLSKEEEEFSEAAENDWRLPQHPPEDDTIQVSTKNYYGFLDMYTGYFAHVSHTENEINELGSDAEKISPHERRETRVKHENEKWDEDYYMADFADDETIQQLISFTFLPESPFCGLSDSNIIFTEEENLIMLRLPSKEYLTSQKQEHSIYLTLVTMLLSYAYDSRTTQNDPTPESAWTICSLTPAFSALDPPPYPALSPITSSSNDPEFQPSELLSTIVPSIRRSLAFPLYRHFALVVQCVRDVSNAFHRGKRGVLRALLGLKDILDSHEVYYVYSKIWVDDMCSWISRHASEANLQQIGKILRNVDVDKSVVGWDLLQLEEATQSALDRVPDSDDEDEDEDGSTDSDNESSPPSSSSSSSLSSSSSSPSSSDAGAI